MASRRAQRWLSLGRGSSPAVTVASVAGGGGISCAASAATPFVTLTYGTTVTIDCSLSNTFRMTFGAGNVTTLNVTNPSDGQTINVRLTQDAVGGRTIVWPATFKFPSGSAVTGVLSTATNAIDFLVCTYDASLTTWFCTLSRAFAT